MKYQSNRREIPAAFPVRRKSYINIFNMSSQGWKAGGMLVNLVLYISTWSLFIYLIHFVIYIIYTTPNAEVPHVSTHCSNLKLFNLCSSMYSQRQPCHNSTANELFDREELPLPLLLKCSKTHQRQPCIFILQKTDGITNNLSPTPGLR